MLLVYFQELLTKKKYKSITLWSHHSMLKCTLKIFEDVDISKYVKLNSFMKKQSIGFESHKSKVFTAKEIETFLNEAPDEEYLVAKVVCILGMTGGLRRHELTDVTVDRVETLVTSKGVRLLQIHIPDTKTNKPRSFVVKNEFMKFDEKYQALRPKYVTSNRFFFNYRNGKCTQQNIGVNKIGDMPKKNCWLFEIARSYFLHRT